MPHQSYPPFGMANMRSRDPQDGKGRDVRLLQELAKLLPGCGHVLKDGKQTALLGKTKVNKFNTNFRDDINKSAWADHIDHFIAAWHGLQMCQELGSSLRREKFECPKSSLWETAGFGGLGAVGRDGTASLCINRERRAMESEWGGGTKPHAEKNLLTGDADLRDIHGRGKEVLK